MIMYSKRILMTTRNKTVSPKKVFQQKNIINEPLAHIVEEVRV